MRFSLSVGKTLVAAATMAALGLAALPASAALVTINNAGFENSSGTADAIPDWTVSHTLAVIFDNISSFGISQAGHGTHAIDLTVKSNDLETNGVPVMHQVLTSAFAAGTYSLSIDIAKVFPNDTHPGGDYVLSLRDSVTNSVLGTTSGQIATTNNDWQTVSLPPVTVNAGDPAIGHAIDVVISRTNITDTFYDNVALDFQAAVPEPTSLALLGIGGVGLLARRRRVG